MRLAAALLLLLLLPLALSWSPMLDFFVLKEQMQRIVRPFNDARINYISNGTVNSYALEFRLPIPFNVSRIHFCWVSRDQRPIAYSINFRMDNTVAMETPKLNISSRGIVPTTVSGFTVSLLCTGEAAAETQFSIDIAFARDASPPTRLRLLRAKFCQRRQPELASVRQTDSTAKPSSSHSSSSSSFVVSRLSAKALAVFLGASFMSVALIAGLFAVYFLRSRVSQNGQTHSRARHRHQHQKHQQHQQHQQQQLNQQGSRTIYHQVSVVRNASKADETCSLTSGYTSCSLPSHQKGASPIVERRITEPRDILLEVQVPWERVTLKCIIMEGSYGRLYKGSLSAEDSQEPAEEVIVKTVIESSRQEQLSCLARDGVLLAGLQHRNVNPLIASSQMPGDPRPHLLYPWPAEGNLKMHLLRCRSGQNNAQHCALSTQQLIHMALQITRGLAYLHRKKVLHKDLACRNCVLSSDQSVQISDSALSKDLFPADYACLGDGEFRPVKWLSVEALVERKFSPASDIWALGVTMWELITRCRQPYREIDEMEISRLLRAGGRLTKPANCPDQLFSIMSSCWQSAPDRRPRLQQLQASLGRFHDEMKEFV